MTKSKTHEPKNTKKLREAQEFVQRFEDERAELQAMKDQFEAEYPEAQLALEAIRVQEDTVSTAIDDAKAKVAAAGTTVGDFRCTRAWAQAGYDDKKLSEIILDMREPGKMIELLIKAGVITEFKVDKASSAAFAASNPKIAEPLNKAWLDRRELTPRVTVPKL
jgi:hypothetical protein